jgi:phosphoglycolate phosphatase-like HAD superfamily hydrolase
MARARVGVTPRDLMSPRRTLESAAAVFWDFDGVLKETLDVKADAFEKLFEPYGGDVAARVRAHHESHGGLSRYEKMPLYLSWAAERADEQRVEEFCSRFSSMVYQCVVDAPWVPGVREYLEAHYLSQRFFVVTATPQPEIDSIIDAIGLRHVVHEVHGAPTKKGVAVRDVLARCDLDPASCVLVGDADADLAAARANGVRFLLRRTPHNDHLRVELAGATFRTLVDE